MTALSLFAVASAGAIVLAGAVLLYNGLIAARKECDRAFSNIDVLLKQRHDELPRLVEVCRGYMAYERETLERVLAARARAAAAQTTEEKAEAAADVTGAVRQLFAVAENYPNLKADETFKHLETRISELETQIADRRELYNAAVTAYNTRLEQLPDMLIANLSGMRARPLWRASTADRQPVAISLP
jgi:LemA protein